MGYMLYCWYGLYGVLLVWVIWCTAGVGISMACYGDTTDHAMGIQLTMI